MHEQFDVFGFGEDEEVDDYFKGSLAPPSRVVLSTYTREPFGGTRFSGVSVSESHTGAIGDIKNRNNKHGLSFGRERGNLQHIEQDDSRRSRKITWMGDVDSQSSSSSSPSQRGTPKGSIFSLSL